MSLKNLIVVRCSAFKEIEAEILKSLVYKNLIAIVNSKKVVNSGLYN